MSVVLVVSVASVLLWLAAGLIHLGSRRWKGHVIEADLSDGGRAELRGYSPREADRLIRALDQPLDGAPSSGAS